MSELILTTKDFDLFSKSLWPIEVVILKLLFTKNEEMYSKLYNSYGEVLMMGHLKALEDKQYIKLMNIKELNELDNIAVRAKTEELFKEEIKGGITFEGFWDEYHKITKLPRTDKVPTLKYWKTLSTKNKVLAFSNIQNYYNSLSDKKYCKKARTYLKDQNFLDEFNNSTSVTSNNRTTAL